jgi:hypothetical protein
MSLVGQNRPNEDHWPNDRFVIRKRPLREALVKDRSWPISAVTAE